LLQINSGKYLQKKKKENEDTNTIGKKKENDKYTEDFVIEIVHELQSKRKHNKKSIEKIAQKFGITNANRIKELTELAIVKACRNLNLYKLSDYERFERVVEIYQIQANLSQRTSQSILLQQYSTPAPISYIASLYVKNGESDNHKFIIEKYFEPSAGNGLLTIALPYENTVVNEVDDIRLENLRTQPFAKILNQDATLPFVDIYKKFEGVVTNPPFGTLSEPVIYDGFPIKTLDHLMALRALDTMRDDGKAAIIIGGHTAWDEQARIQAGKNRIFFNYLYSHYKVEDVILIDGHKLYSRQGTSFDVRLILIDGRKSQVEGVAPLKTSLSEKVVTDFEDLWERVFGRFEAHQDMARQAFYAKDFISSLKQKENRLRIAKVKAVSKLKILNLLTI
jgi:hypothetical protein